MPKYFLLKNSPKTYFSFEKQAHFVHKETKQVQALIPTNTECEVGCLKLISKH